MLNLLMPAIFQTDFVSAIGHADTARIVESIIDKPVPYNRTTVSLNKNGVLLGAQYESPRLPEGATELPEGVTIQFLRVTVG